MLYQRQVYDVVKQLFDTAPDRAFDMRFNPVTRGGFVPGLDPIGPQIAIVVVPVCA
jgi:hypothetical protein